MTTIAYDGNMIAADTLVSHGDVLAPGPLRKLWHIKVDGRQVVVGGAGNPCVLMMLARLYCKNAGIIAKHHALVPAPVLPADMGGSIIVLDAQTRRAYFMGEDGCAVDITSKQWACGSGRRFALGAMAAGASARKAIKIAAQFDPDTGGEIQWVEVHDLPNIQSWMEVE